MDTCIDAHGRRGRQHQRHLPHHGGRGRAHGDEAAVGERSPATGRRSISTRPGVPHPRNYSTNVRVLGHYVRDQKVLTLPEAVRKMTSLPAAILGLTDRGQIKAGLAADIAVFDPAQRRRDQLVREAEVGTPRACRTCSSTAWSSSTRGSTRARGRARRCAGRQRKLRAMRKSFSSCPRRATSCRPTGRPALRAGIEMAGVPAALNGQVLRRIFIRRWGRRWAAR